MAALEFRNLLESGDIEGLRSYWLRAFPAMPQPQTREDAEIVMHRARTETKSISLRARAWSHAWLAERLLPSGLPDALRPKAERMFPIVRRSVGISVNSSNPRLRPAMAEIRGAMEAAVLEAYADGRQDDPEFIRARMAEARESAARRLFGG